MKRPTGFDGGTFGQNESEPSSPAADDSPLESVVDDKPAPLAEVTPIPVGDTLEQKLPETELEESSPALAQAQESDGRVRSAERALARARESRRKREKREKQRFTAHLRRRRRTWLIAAGAVLGLALFVAVGTLSPMTAVREVRVQGASMVSMENLQTALSRFEGVPLTLVRDTEIHRALEPFSLIQKYSVERIPPHTLVVKIEERDPVIAVAEDDEFRLLDPAGVLVSVVEEAESGIPTAEGGAADPASPAFAAAGMIIRDLPADIRKKLVSVTATSAQDVEFVLDDGTRVLWGEAARTQQKAAVLRSMMKSVPQAAKIDVSAPDAPVFE